MNFLHSLKATNVYAKVVHSVYNMMYDAIATLGHTPEEVNQICRNTTKPRLPDKLPRLELDVVHGSKELFGEITNTKSVFLKTTYNYRYR